MMKVFVPVLLLFLVGAPQATPAPWPEFMLRGANVTTNLTEEDMAHFANVWKGNSVRFLVNNYLPSEPPYRVSEQQKQKIYQTLDLCLKYNVYTIFSPSAAFEDNDGFFSNPQFRKAYLEMWEEVAVRYKNAGPIAYDLMNEPHDKLARTEWNGYAKELTAAIRKIDKAHTIVVEPPEWGWPNGFQYLEPTGDPNTVYSFHFYGPMDFTHQRNNGMMKATEEEWKQRVYPGSVIQGEVWDRDRLAREIALSTAFRDKHGVRIWCGEFGVARWALGALTWFVDWVELLERERIGWSYYSYREWWPMDLEMDPFARMERSKRGDTYFVKLLKGYFATDK